MANETTTRSSPGVHRVAAILKFMADHPGQAFVLTDLVRALKLSRATCHALLTGLVEVGFLYRTNDKSYVLGPALAAIGRIAVAHFSPLQVAQPELRRLADAHDLIASAYLLEGGSVVVRERAASASHLGYLGPAGTKLKLRVQTAALFFAWSPEKRVKAWLDSQAPPLSKVQLEELERGMAFARDNEFIAIVRASPPNLRHTDLALETDLTNVAVALAPEIKPSDSYSLAALVAPVFDRQRRIAFAIGLAGFESSLRGSEVLKTAGELTAVCGRITEFIVGHDTPLRD